MGRGQCSIFFECGWQLPVVCVFYDMSSQVVLWWITKIQNKGSSICSSTWLSDVCLWYIHPPPPRCISETYTFQLTCRPLDSVIATIKQTPCSKISHEVALSTKIFSRNAFSFSLSADFHVSKCTHRTSLSKWRVAFIFSRTGAFWTCAATPAGLPSMPPRAGRGRWLGWTPPPSPSRAPLPTPTWTKYLPRCQSHQTLSSERTNRHSFALLARHFAYGLWNN